MLRPHTTIVRNPACWLTLAFAIWLLAPQAHADASSAADGQRMQDSVTSYAFDDEIIHGDGLSPNGEVLQVLHKPSTGSLVRARISFVDQLLKSVESL